jgi:hypothetical protein
MPAGCVLGHARCQTLVSEFLPRSNSKSSGATGR